MANATKTVQKTFNPGYAAFLRDGASMERYAQKLGLLSGTDLYEETRQEDDIDTWPAVTRICTSACTSFFILVRTQGMRCLQKLG